MMKAISLSIVLFLVVHPLSAQMPLDQFSNPQKSGSGTPIDGFSRSAERVKEPLAPGRYQNNQKVDRLGNQPTNKGETKRETAQPAGLEVMIQGKPVQEATVGRITILGANFPRGFQGPETFRPASVSLTLKDGTQVSANGSVDKFNFRINMMTALGEDGNKVLIEDIESVTISWKEGDQGEPRSLNLTTTKVINDPQGTRVAFQSANGEAHAKLGSVTFIQGVLPNDRPIPNNPTRELVPSTLQNGTQAVGYLELHGNNFTYECADPSQVRSIQFNGSPPAGSNPMPQSGSNPASQAGPSQQTVPAPTAPQQTPVAPSPQTSQLGAGLNSIPMDDNGFRTMTEIETAKPELSRQITNSVVAPMTKFQIAVGNREDMQNAGQALITSVAQFNIPELTTAMTNLVSLCMDPKGIVDPQFPNATNADIIPEAVVNLNKALHPMGLHVQLKSLIGESVGLITYQVSFVREVKLGRATIEEYALDKVDGTNLFNRGSSLSGGADPGYRFRIMDGSYLNR